MVQPGKYVENINFNGKNIVVGSLTLTTGESSYISKTIIDGNLGGSVVYFEDGEETSAVLCGFTITKGTGGGACPTVECHEWAGGITCASSSPTFSDLRIIRNFGMGLFLNNSNAKLSNLTITENWGGIHIVSTSRPVFDNVNRCNIYLNYGETGGDIYSSNDSFAVNIFVDTFTVVNPTEEYAYFENENYTLDILHAKLEQVNSDLYVNPHGNNNNSGLSPSEPLRTLTFALFKILADSLNPSTIYLADGEYTENILPINDYVSISGESRSGVIFNSEDLPGVRFNFDNSRGASLENITIVGDGTTSGINCRHSDPIIKNITLDGVGMEIFESSPYIENIKISKTNFVTALGISYADVSLKNLEITNTHSEWGAIDCRGESHINLFNATISNNTSSHEVWNGGISVRLNSNYSISITNSIILDNPPVKALKNNLSDIIITHSLLSVEKNDIQGGNVFWLDGNINADPMFVDTTLGDYRLKEGSPCIDKGIQDTTIMYGKGILYIPPMAYNGAAPDMGAYEYGDPLLIEQESDITPSRFSLFQNYPNPFNPVTMINYQLPVTSAVELSIYNLLGQRVATLVNERKRAGYHQVEWDASGYSTGIYYYQLKAGEFHDVKKMILIK